MALGDYIDWCDLHSGTAYIKKETASGADLLTEAGVRAFGEYMDVDLVIYINLPEINYSNIEKRQREYYTVVKEPTSHDAKGTLEYSIKTAECSMEAFFIDIRNGGKRTNSTTRNAISVEDWFIGGTYTTEASSTLSGLVDMYSDQVNVSPVNHDLRRYNENNDYIYNGFMYCSLFGDEITVPNATQINTSYQIWETSTDYFLRNEMKNQVADKVDELLGQSGY